jgi:hypothetical protein
MAALHVRAREPAPSVEEQDHAGARHALPTTWNRTRTQATDGGAASIGAHSMITWASRT